ncbi:MAG TPA: type I-C CRISPR-associated protein Cas8c/Csd1 [Clostridiales bacterium]|nr:type I-C CRISPR-associated protein Cas8c/Csd1 [Clostridiales bacterium]
MLIKALCDYADALSTTGKNSIPDGFSSQNVHFEILLTPDGEIGGIIDIREEKEGSGSKEKTKTYKVPTKITLPERTQKPTIYSNIIEHRPLYIFGLNYDKGVFTPDDKTNKARKSHKCFREFNREFFADIDSEIARAYCNYIDKWNAENETENEYLKEREKEYSTSSFCFGLHGNPAVRLDKDSAFLEKYKKYLEDKSSEKELSDVNSTMCSILGENLPVARIHDKISKLTGGNTTGCVLVGMKESAFESYGKTQSFNSGVSEIAMKKYTQTLNALLSDKSHYVVFGDVTILYFAIKNDGTDDANECYVFSSALSLSDSEKAEMDLGDLFLKAKSGILGEVSSLGADLDATFYVVGLTANATRICQKFIMRDNFGRIIEHIAEHQQDLKLDGRLKQVYFSSIIKELVSPKSKEEKVPPPLISAIFEAMLNGTRYPEALLATTIRRIKTDSDDDKNSFSSFATRVAIIKACLNRKARLSDKKEEITMSLNTENNSPAYLCGRLFAVLEKIQIDSYNVLPDGTIKAFSDKDKPNRTIKDSFFSSACSKPSTVFPRLIQLSHHHMKKLNNTKYNLFGRYNKLMEEVIDKLDKKFPSTLDNDKQGEFIIGYYQQSQSFYKSKETKTEDVK